MMQAGECTLYCGGHSGAEAAFGALAEKWGATEVNFSYEGRETERSRGLSVLSADDLKKGDISMEIVCMRMNREYSKADKIRKVMQLLFHMVNKGYQVFAVGWIQENGTVKGGTGWGVELAKLFNRPLSVFDQDRNAWFSWEENKWVESVPVIEHKTFVGTGTRRLSEAGAKALDELFKRSFG